MNTSIKSINETNEKLCYVMDLKKEYGPNKVGKENYALITDMSETELKETYGDTLKQYEPYVMMTLEMGEVIFESHRNDWKHLKRQVKYGCDYSVSDEEFDEHHSLDGMVLASLFFQPSTRTQFSFQSAFLKLGGSIIECADINETRSGAPYYEPIGDMAKIISNYSDIVVMRTENNLQTVEMDANIEVPFISAGSGNIEHPTQALTDLYTVRQYFGALESHDILIIGTPRQRTINSFIKGMSLWAKQNYHILCQEGVCINQDVKKSLGKSNVTYYSSWDDIYESGIYKNISIIYMDKFFYETNRHSIYVPDEKMFKTHFSKEAIILHPLPRTQELPCFFDDLNNAKYFVQAKNGLYIRSGLFLHYLL